MEELLSRYILRNAKKVKSIEYKGGKCIKCGDTAFEHLCFHHKDKDQKEEEISRIIECRWSIIQGELDKCDLVCGNCHTEIHYSKSIKNKRSKNKSVFLEFKNTDKCMTCGYDKCNDGLEFHHTEGKTIEISNINRRFNNIADLEQSIIGELNGCIVVCSNCHNSIHFNKEKFLKHQKEIEKKSKDLKELQPKIDRDVVRRLLNEGYRQIDIAKKLNAAKSSISCIVKEIRSVR